MVGLAFNKPLYRFIFGLLARVQTRFTGASGGVGTAGQSEACLQHNTLERLSSITAPTLVIVGTGDRIIKPVSSEVIAGKIPNAKLVKVEGGSHYFSFEMKNVFNREVLNFLKSEALRPDWHGVPGIRLTIWSIRARRCLSYLGSGLRLQG
jgi:pimeloyl-ACP methyl ester carboxylesterase